MKNTIKVKLKMFAKEFQDACEKKYQQKKEVYGESWKRMSIADLQRRLIEEFEEWEFNKDKHWSIAYDELIDVRNCASMLAERMKKKGSENDG